MDMLRPEWPIFACSVISKPIQKGELLDRVAKMLSQLTGPNKFF
jgi:hypothetical protein